ncbi:MAG: HAD family hydrolase [Eubacteriales bacterium]|nr:HAD family hydrolase [Eubacteriales bacterium]
MIKLIASDVDGTLMRDGEFVIPPALFPLIHDMRKKGIYFAACSGRQYANLRRLFAPVADEIGYICENGSLTVWQNEIVDKQTIDQEKARLLLRTILAQPDCEALLSGVNTCYIQPKYTDYISHMRDYVGNDTTVVEDICAVNDEYIKISAYRKSGVDAQLAGQFADFAPYLIPVVGRSSWMDFLREGCDKGTAMDALCSHLDIAVHESIVFGDNENDLPLYGHAGTLYAMADGHPKLIEKADRTTMDVVKEIHMILEGTVSIS